MGRSKGQFTQSTRCFRVLDRLRGYREGVPINELADEFQVKREAIQEDIDALEIGGFRIDYEYKPVQGPSGKVRTMAVAVLREESHRAVNISREERYTLLAMRRIFDVLKGTPFYRDVESVFAKLIQRVPLPDREELASWGERFVYVPDGGVKDYRAKGEVLDVLRTAVLNRRIVRYTYSQASGREQQGLLAPYALVLYRQGLYVVGRRLARVEDAAKPPAPGSIAAPFAAERFSAVEAVSGRRSYEVPKDLKLDTLFQGAFGIFIGDGKEPQRVVIEFSRTKRAHVLSRTWHPTQRVEQLPDGRVRLEFMLCDWKEVVSWVMSWGPHAHVLEPIGLAAKVAQEHADAAECYAARGTLSPECTQPEKELGKAA